ncbi:hypothetical protein J6590_007673 [Homalodisca vitripennis]|nr:hypothetical protein J6590_007673 [Homalodisca vitripennis]
MVGPGKLCVACINWRSLVAKKSETFKVGPYVLSTVYQLEESRGEEVRDLQGWTICYKCRVSTGGVSWRRSERPPSTVYQLEESRGEEVRDLQGWTICFKCRVSTGGVSWRRSERPPSAVYQLEESRGEEVRDLQGWTICYKCRVSTGGVSWRRSERPPSTVYQLEESRGKEVRDLLGWLQGWTICFKYRVSTGGVSWRRSERPPRLAPRMKTMNNAKLINRSAKRTFNPPTKRGCPQGVSAIRAHKTDYSKTLIFIEYLPSAGGTVLFKYVESEFISGPNDGLSRMLKGLQYSYVIPLSTYPSLFNMIH